MCHSETEQWFWTQATESVTLINTPLRPQSLDLSVVSCVVSFTHGVSIVCQVLRWWFFLITNHSDKFSLLGRSFLPGCWRKGKIKSLFLRQMKLTEEADPPQVKCHVSSFWAQGRDGGWQQQEPTHSTWQIKILPQCAENRGDTQVPLHSIQRPLSCYWVTIQQKKSFGDFFGEQRIVREEGRQEEKRLVTTQALKRGPARSQHAELG